MSTKAPMKRQPQGVTLIELAVVLAIVAILLSQAGSYFASWTQNVQIRTASESIQNGLQLARSEAIRRNRSVMFWLTSTATPAQADWLVGCSSPPPGPPSTPEAPGDCPGSHTTAGPTYWIQRQAAADQQTALPQVTITPANANNVTFNSLGMVIANIDGSASITQIDVSIPSLPTSSARPLRVTISGGQVRMCDPALNPTTDPRGC
jgi:type IV fimbrial biogenesis protein FimT